MEPLNLAEHDDSRDDEHSIPDDRLRSSSVSSGSAESASSDFSFEDPYQLDLNENGSFVLDHDHDLDQSDPASDYDNSAGATPGSTSTLENPPVQVMERPPDASTYRIPSYVFARNKSSAPNPDWSTASNESLFSIHTGNMSFTRDQFNWLLKSGELGMYNPGDIRKSGEIAGMYNTGDIHKSGEVAGMYNPGDVRKSGELAGMYNPGDIRNTGELPPPSPRIVQKPAEQKPVDLYKSGEQMPPTPPDTRKSGEHIIANHFKASATTPPAVNRPSDVEVISSPKVSEPVVSPDASVNTKKDDPKPEMKVKKKGRSTTSDEVPFSTSVSHHSDASGQSFAFPVLAEIDREKSVNSGQSRAEQLKNSSKNRDQEGSKSPTSAPPAATSSASWLSSCFSCCSCC